MTIPWWGRRGRGLMAGVELVRDRAARTKFPTSQFIGRRVMREAVHRGVLFRALPGDVIAMSPPLILTKSQAAQMVELCGVRLMPSWTR